MNVADNCERKAAGCQPGPEQHCRCQGLAPPLPLSLSSIDSIATTDSLTDSEINNTVFFSRDFQTSKGSKTDKGDSKKISAVLYVATYDLKMENMKHFHKFTNIDSTRYYLDW